MIENEVLFAWLSQLDACKIECDGFTRAAATLLIQQGILFRVFVGRLAVVGVGSINWHTWIKFGDGSICDFRARQWLGNSPMVPHGIFHPRPSQNYIEVHEATMLPLSDYVMRVLTDLPEIRPLADYIKEPV